MMTFTRHGRRRRAALPESSTAYRPSRLGGFLLLGYALLIVTGSLYPFSGWRWPPEPVWSFLSDPWPRYLVAWEIPLNVAGYVPFGALAVMGLRNARSTVSAVSGATFAGALLSLTMELTQVFITGRIASNLDVASNAFGALLGSTMAVVADLAWDLRPKLRRLRRSIFVEGTYSDLATTLLLAWLFAQINPLIGMLGTTSTGEAHDGGLGLITYSAMNFLMMETLLTCMNALYLLVLLRMLTRSTQASLAGLLLLTVASMLLKTAGGALLLRVAVPLVWATPGALLGWILAVVLFIAWSRRSGGNDWRLGLAVFLGIQVVALLMPRNPYLAAMLQPLAGGHLAHVTGATWWTAQVWPWLVLICLSGLAARRRNRIHARR